MRATLMVLRRGGRVWLIHKKRGLGQGKINAPGGRIESGETPEACAIRECHEETGLLPTRPQRCGDLEFTFTQGLRLHCHVFSSRTFTGLPIETDEARPFWCDETAIPYPRMWADDALWFPLLLTQTPFYGRFLFDESRMMRHDIHIGNLRHGHTD